jgi:hypothetical protein
MNKFSYILSLIIFLLSVFCFYLSLDEFKLEYFFNSDLLYLPSLYKDIFIDKFSFSGWRITPAPYFFPDMLIYFILMFLTNNFLLSTYLFGFMQSLTFLILVSILIKELIPKVSYYELVLINLVVSVIIISLSVDLILFSLFVFLFMPSIHFGAFISTLLGVILLFKYLRKEKTPYLISIFLLVFIGSLSDRIFLIMFVVPTLLSLSILFVLNKPFSKIYFNIIVGILISSILAFLSYRFMPFIPSFGSMMSMLNSFKVFLKDIKNFLFSSFPFFLMFVFCISSLVFTLVILYKELRDEPKDIFLIVYLLFFIFFTFFVLFIPIARGIYIDIGGCRYNMHVFLYGIVNLAILMVYILKSKKFLNYLNVILSLVIIIILISFPINSRLKDLLGYYPKTTKFLDEISKEYNLKYGISDYWNAKFNTMFSKSDLRIYAVCNDKDLRPYHWISNIKWYKGEEKSKYFNPCYKLVILNGLNESFVLKKFGEPFVKLNKEGLKVYLYNECLKLKFN